MSKSGKFSKKIVIISYVLVILFTIACLVYQFVAKDSVSDNLITWFYSFCGVEMLSIAGIKSVKILSKKSKKVIEGEEGED